MLSYHVDQYGHRIDDKNGGRVWSEKYYKARREAEEHAKKRGECFEKSKKAFNENRKGEAKTLSDEGIVYLSHEQKIKIIKAKYTYIKNYKEKYMDIKWKNVIRLPF